MSTFINPAQIVTSGATVTAMVKNTRNQTFVLLYNDSKDVKRAYSTHQVEYDGLNLCCGHYDMDFDRAMESLQKRATQK